MLSPTMFANTHATNTLMKNTKKKKGKKKERKTKRYRATEQAVNQDVSTLIRIRDIRSVDIRYSCLITLIIRRGD